MKVNIVILILIAEPIRNNTMSAFKCSDQQQNTIYYLTNSASKRQFVNIDNIGDYILSRVCLYTNPVPRSLSGNLLSTLYLKAGASVSKVHCARVLNTSSRGSRFTMAPPFDPRCGIGPGRLDNFAIVQHPSTAIN